jgi:hypothetical protein
MAVLVEAITVVVPRDTLERVYAGGVDAYEIDCPNATFCTDDHLTSVGFMTPTDVRAFVERLVDAGLGFVDAHGFLDVAVVNERTGPTAACEWLAFSRLRGNYSMCWLLGTDPDELAIPAGRHPETLGTMRFVPIPLKDVETQLEHLESDERGLETYRDRGTGKVLYVGRAFRTPIKQALELRDEALARWQRAWSPAPGIGFSVKPGTLPVPRRRRRMACHRRFRGGMATDRGKNTAIEGI